MHAVVLTAPGRMESRQLPVPEIGTDELLVKVFATGICGSDLSVYRGVHPYKTAPIVLGHELAGRVEKVGAEVLNLAPGDRVCAASFSPCGGCRACRSGETHLCADKKTLCAAGWNGSFAEYVVLRQNMTFELPAEVDWQIGALVEPLSIGFHAARIAARQDGRTMAILGSGNIGLCCLVAADQLGFRVACVDIRPQAGGTAEALGAEAFVDARFQAPAVGVREAIGERGVDVTIVAADHPDVFDDALAVTAPGGTVVVVSYFATPPRIPLNELVGGELTVVGSALSTADDMETVLRWLADGTVDPRPMIAHHPTLAEAAEAMALMDRGVGLAGKIVIDVSPLHPGESGD